jgi:hypothetical protein
MGTRQYNPETGRFLSIDPVQGGSANQYDYVWGDPINAYDIAGRSGHRDTPSNGKCYALGSVCVMKLSGYAIGLLWHVLVSTTLGVASAWAVVFSTVAKRYALFAVGGLAYAIFVAYFSLVWALSTLSKKLHSTGAVYFISLIGLPPMIVPDTVRVSVSGNGGGSW